MVILVLPLNISWSIKNNIHELMQLKCYKCTKNSPLHIPHLYLGFSHINLHRNNIKYLFNCHLHLIRLFKFFLVNMHSQYLESII